MHAYIANTQGMTIKFPTIDEKWELAHSPITMLVDLNIGCIWHILLFRLA